MDLTHPGHKEIYAKVESALAAVTVGRFMIGAPDHLAADLSEIQIETADFWTLIQELLNELKCAVPGNCYRGSRPKPQLAGEPLVKGEKLWAFVWESQRLGIKAYLKFCLVESKSGVIYAHIRIHENRPPT